MPADLSVLLGREVLLDSVAYDDKDVLLYNLSVGMGRDPLDPGELPFVLETAGLAAVPALAAVLGSYIGSMLWNDALIDLSRIVHGEERLTLHRPLPPTGVLSGYKRIIDVADKGPGRGAIITLRKELSLPGGAPVFASDQRIFIRGGGGFGGGPGVIADQPPVPTRAPDKTETFETRRDQALLYRLNGDRHLLHADPVYARNAGFPGPILHGLCTYGIACRAILALVCDNDPSRLAAFATRMSAPVYPGDTLLTEVWVDGADLAFRTRVPARDVTVLDCGTARIVASRPIPAA